MEQKDALVLSPVLLQYAKTLYSELGRTHSTVGVQGAQQPEHGFDRFLEDLVSPHGNAVEPILLDASHPISDYFISSSHNTYLSGNQLTSKASTNAYRDVLLSGCRCVEIDVWDGEDPSSSESSSDNDNEGKAVKGLRGRLKRGLGKLRSRSKSPGNQHESSVPQPDVIDEQRLPTPWRSQANRVEPRVLHGHTVTKEVPFRKVCETIRNYAFRTSDLPIIVSLEIHTSHAQQEIMVEIMKDLWGPYLVNLDGNIEEMTPLPTLESIRKKILIKVKYSPPNKAAATAATKPIEKAEPNSSEDEAQTDTAKKGKIIEALGGMGIYTRSCHFKGFDQPEATIPTHVFSLSESKIAEVHKTNASALFRHNKSYLMRVYPKGLRLTSGNLSPEVFWRKGSQIVALNWQTMNEAMMLNQAMFEGTGGWVLKPTGYRSSHDSHSQIEAAPRCMLDLAIEIFAGQNIGKLKHREKLRPYVKCELHVEQPEETMGAIPDGGNAKEGEIKVSTKRARGGDSPSFAGQVLRFAGVTGVVPQLTFVRFKVMDDDVLSGDDLVAWACFRLDRLREGVRLVNLYDKDSQKTEGVLLVRIRKSCTYPASMAA